MIPSIRIRNETFDQFNTTLNTNCRVLYQPSHGVHTITTSCLSLAKKVLSTFICVFTAEPEFTQYT